MLLMHNNTEVYDITNEEVLSPKFCPGIISTQRGSKKAFIEWMGLRRTSNIKMDNKEWFQKDLETYAQSPFDCYWIWNEEGQQPIISMLKDKADYAFYLGNRPYLAYDRKCLMLEINREAHAHYLKMMRDVVSTKIFAEIKATSFGYTILDLTSDVYYIERLDHCKEWLTLQNSEDRIYNDIARILDANTALDLSFADEIVDYRDRDASNTYLYRLASTGDICGLAPIVFWEDFGDEKLTLAEIAPQMNMSNVFNRTKLSDKEIAFWLQHHNWHRAQIDDKEVAATLCKYHSIREEI